jgi:membrane peptidoglycan carboxypeptidase
VLLKDISPLMQKAIIAAEDHAFYQHNGVDVKGIVRAFVANRNAKETTQGASTLTMQYVRMSIAYSATHPRDVVAATEDTSGRKAREAKNAMQVEKELTKDQILERYLNMAPFGNGSYGVFAASQVYFGKHPRDLTIDEAATLAGMVKAPTTNDPKTEKGYPKSVVRRDYIIDNMLKIGAITAAEATAAKAVDLKPKLKGKRAPNGCVSVNKNHWGFFCDYFYRWWLEQETFGATGYDRERRLKSGGYRIVTTLDPKIQEVTRNNVAKKLKDNHKHALMVASVEPGSGRVRSLAVNRFFKLDDPANPKNKVSTNPDKAKRKIRGTYPNTTNPLITGGGDIHGYQAGSTFKIFTMAAALANGYPLATTIKAPTMLKTNFNVGYGERSACPGTNKWCPKNADPGMAGVRNMWTGFGRSVNTFFVKLEEMVGADKAVEMAQRLGINFREPEDADLARSKASAAGWGAFTLGVSATTPLDLANAYATLAADGKRCEATPVQEIRDHAGAKLDIANPRCRQVIDPQVARATVDAARCPVGDRSSTSRCDSGTATGVRGAVGKPVFGKTGTTDSNRTASLAVSAKQLSVAGILADPDWAQTNASMDHNLVNPAVYQTLGDALKGQPSKNFTPPSGKIVFGDQRSIPNVKCQPVESARSQLSGAGFSVDVDPTPVDSDCPKGMAAGTSPEGQTIKNGFVTIEVSSGKRGADDDQPDAPGRPGRPGRPPGR